MSETRSLLDAVGIFASLLMIGALVRLRRRREGEGGFPFLALLFLEAGLYFLADLLGGERRWAGLALALNLGSNFYALPSLHAHIRRSLGLAPGKLLPHYAPALLALVLGSFLGLRSAAQGFRGDLPLALYIGALPLVQSLQLVFYARAGLRLCAASKETAALWGRRLLLAALLGYGVFVLLNWLAILRLFAADLLGWKIGAGGAIDLSSLLVAVFLIWTLGLGSLWGLERRRMTGPKYGGKELPEAEREALLSRLTRLLAEEEDLSSSSLSPRRLAEGLGVPYYLLSRAVNEGRGESLAELLNGHRVERAKLLMARRPEAGLLEIALESGFQAKSTFNEVFKRRTGSTPGDWRKTRGTYTNN